MLIPEYTRVRAAGTKICTAPFRGSGDTSHTTRQFLLTSTCFTTLKLSLYVNTPSHLDC